MFGRKASNASELDTGDSVPADGREFLRMWDSESNGGICFISPHALDPDPFVFGMMLADAMRHGALAYAGAVDIGEDEAMIRIMEGLKAELENPTSEPE